MDSLSRYFQQNPQVLLVHAVNVRVESRQDDTLHHSTFTVLRNRTQQLLNVLLNLDFERLVVSPATYQLHDAVQLMSLQAPLWPSASFADTSDAAPYASAWSEHDGRVKKLPEARAYRPDLVMKVLQKSKKTTLQSVKRNELAAKADAIVSQSEFDELIVFPVDENMAESDYLRDADERVVKLADLFDMVDVDHSGEIVLEEMRIVLKSKGYSDDFVEHLFYHMDLDKDKRIKRSEFYQALRFLPVEIFSEGHSQTNEQLLRYFDEFDTDGNGTLSWPEFHAALLNRGMTEEFIQKYFADLDLDDSKTVSRDEYARCIGLKTEEKK